MRERIASLPSLAALPRRIRYGLLTMATVLVWAGGWPGHAQFLGFVEAEFDGVAGVDGLDGAHAVVVSPDGKHLYVAADQDDAVAVFARDPTTGALTWVETEKDGLGGVDGLDGAESLALDPSGAHLYVGGLLDSAIAVFSRNATSGELTFVEVHRDGVLGVNGLAGVSGVAVSPDGLHVYAAGRFDDAVALFQRNPMNGRLSFVGVEIDGLGGVDGLADVTAVAVSPDGHHVYAAGVLDQEVAVFARNSSTGELDFLTAVADTLPEGNLDIDDHRSLVLSADGAHLYVVNHVEALTDGWIATFSRNSTSGLLTAVPPVILGDAVDVCFLGIEGDSTLALDPDGTGAWANLPFDSAVAAFARDPSSGALTLLGAVCDETIGMGGDPGAIDGLWGSQAVAVDPAARQVYVASGNLEDAAAVLTIFLFNDGFESGMTDAWSLAVP